MSTRDEDRLSRSLHDHAGEAGPATTGLDEVRRRARRLQQRRRLTTGLAAVAVAAVVVPLGITAADRTVADRSVAPATTSTSDDATSDATEVATPDATPSTTPDATPTATPAAPEEPTVTADPRSAEPPRPALTVQDAPDGAPAAITYLRGRTLVVPGADPVDLPASYDTVAPYRGGWLAVQRNDQGQTYVVHIDASGQVTGSTKGGGRIVTSQDGVELAWVEGDKLLLDSTNGHSEQPQSVALPAGTTSASPVGFVGSGSVLFSTADQTGQRFFVSDFSKVSPVDDVLQVRATDESSSRIGVQTSFNSDTGTSCWAVVTHRPVGGEPTTCDWTLETFSPDGAHVVGYPSGTDGLGSSTVALLDSRTVKPVVTFDRRGNADTFVADTAWEDDSHVLVSLHEGGSWYLVRLGLDGSVQKVDGTTGSAEESPYRFAAHS